jgi:hypothetical protein
MEIFYQGTVEFYLEYWKLFGALEEDEPEE